MVSAPVFGNFKPPGPQLWFSETYPLPLHCCVPQEGAQCGRSWSSGGGKEFPSLWASPFPLSRLNLSCVRGWGVYINKREYLPAASLGRGDQRGFSHFKGLWLPWRAGELCLPTSRRLSWILALSSSPPSSQLLKLSQTPSGVLGGLVGALIWREGEKLPPHPVNATSKGPVAMATSSLSQE